MSQSVSFRRAFDRVLRGINVRAVQWSKEYYLTFSQGELWLEPQHISIRISQLAVWRVTYKEWEVKV